MHIPEKAIKVQIIQKVFFHIKKKRTTVFHHMENAARKQTYTMIQLQYCANSVFDILRHSGSETKNDIPVQSISRINSLPGNPVF